MIIFFFVWVHNFVVKCHISKGEVDEIELPYNSVCKQKKKSIWTSTFKFTQLFHLTIAVGNIDSLKDFFAMLNLELNGCITKKDILFTLLIANVLDFEFIFKNLCAM